MQIQNILYQPYYCEENIWQLCQSPELERFTKKVVFISNEIGSCPFWQQKKAPSEDSPLFWDYHVVLLARISQWFVFDLDTRLGYPISLAEYLEKTFRGLDSSLFFPQPKFKIIDAKYYINRFYSDRKHMLDSKGQWKAQPPTWPAIQGSPSVTDNDRLYLNDLINFSLPQKTDYHGLKTISLSDFRSWSLV